MRLKAWLPLIFLILLSFCVKDDRAWVETKFDYLELWQVYYINNQYYIFGRDSNKKLIYLTSTDGINWNQSSTGMNAGYVFYLNNIFVLNFTDPKANNYSLAYSSDLISWQYANPNLMPIDYNLIYGKSQYYATHSQLDANGDPYPAACGEYITSADLNTWNKITLPNSDWCFHHFLYAANKYFAAGDIKNQLWSYRVFSSDDGLNWHEIQYFHGNYISNMVYSNNEFIFVGDGGGIYTSPDGENWTNHSIFLGPIFNNVARNNQEYMFLPGSGDAYQEIWSTPDFWSWKQYSYKEKSFFFEYGGSFNDIATDGTTFVVVGEENWADTGPYGVILTTQ